MNFNGQVIEGYSNPVYPDSSGTILNSTPTPVIDNNYYGGGNTIIGPVNNGPMPGPADAQKPVVPAEAGGAGGADGKAGEAGGNDTTILNIELPEDALVYVNGRPTRSTGSSRSFVARRLEPGKDYSFEVRAILHEGDRELVRNQLVTVRGGQARQVKFDFSADAPLTTTVAVQVPAEARIRLAGVDTAETGTTRIFATDMLKEGQSWSDYKVVATLERNGETLVREFTLNVVAGQMHQIKVDFDDPTTRVASR